MDDGSMPNVHISRVGFAVGSETPCRLRKDGMNQVLIYSGMEQRA